MALARVAGLCNLSSVFDSCRQPSCVGASSSDCELVLEIDLHRDAARLRDYGCASGTASGTAKPSLVQHSVCQSSDVDSDASTTVAESLSVREFSLVDSGSEGEEQASLSRAPSSQVCDNDRAEPQHARFGGASCCAAEAARRLGVDFQESLSSWASNSRSGWVHDHVQQGLECSFRVADGNVNFVTVAEFPDHDPLLAFAAFCEADLCMAYKPNVVNATLLDEAAADHSLWLVKQMGKFSGRLEDTLVEISAIDALDEPVGSLWVCISTPLLEDLSENWCAPIPAVQKGVQRIDSGRTTCWITPLRGEDKKARGFRIITEVVAPAPAAVSRMPTFALRVLMRRGAQEFAERFQKHIAAGGVVDQRIRSSARAELYARIKERL